jgi:CRP-like cAMP-binding protein
VYSKSQSYESNHNLHQCSKALFVRGKNLLAQFKIDGSVIIDIDTLVAWGGTSKVYKKNEVIFHEGDVARCYYQIIEGSVKMFNTNAEGREFIQGVFHAGDSFGEPPLFINEVYPASSKVLKQATIMKVSKENFLKILESSPTLQKSFLSLMARRAFGRAITLREIINHTPEDKILAFLDAQKRKSGYGLEKRQISFTRQEIANFTGLRVETVIRTLAKMKETGKVDIINRKLYY